HRHHRVAVAHDPGAIAKRLIERLTKDDSDVFGGVVSTRLEVSGGLDAEVEPAVTGEQLEHVIEEADTRRELGATGPVEGEVQLYLRLARRSLDLRRARLSGVHSVSLAL